MTGTIPSEMLIATNNTGKLLEFSELFSELPIKFYTLKDFPDITDIPETGSTFEENAALKAKGYAKQTGLWTLADDSGLEVSILKGAPGIYSARYAGEKATIEEKIKKLLDEVEKTGDKEKRARFVCTISLADKSGNLIHSETRYCEGNLTAKPRGHNGFGYDPVFIPEGFEQTFGELSKEIKQQISHRARAASQIKRFLLDFFQFSLDQARFES